MIGLTEIALSPIALRDVSLSIVGGGVGALLGGDMSAILPRSHDSQSHIWRHYSISDWYEIWAPHGPDGHYAVLTYNTWSRGIWAPGRLREGIIGTHVHHASGSVTKTGTFGAFSNGEIYGGSAGWSATSGDTFECSVAGSTLGLRLVYITNGGFATVAIDGDYTAADRLPAVTSADISAGYFDAEQEGHRYICCYANATNAERRDVHVVLSESQSAGSHDITVRVQGTRPAGSGDRVYVSAFIGAAGAQKPGEAGTAMLYTQEADQSRTLNLSAMEMAWRFTPESGGAEQWIGANHANETLNSSTIKIDGASQTFTADQIRSGASVSIERDISMTHPDAVGDVAQKTDSVTATAGAALSFRYAANISFDQAGTMGVSYSGMLRRGDATGGMLERAHFAKGVIGRSSLADLTQTTGNAGQARETVVALYDDDHDTVMLLHTTDVTTNVNNWSLSDPTYAFVSLDSAGGKAYMTRVGFSHTEDVTSETVIQQRFGWRVLRIDDAASKIEAAVNAT